MLAIAGAALAAGVEGFSTARSFNVARQVSWRRDTAVVVTRTCPSDAICTGPLEIFEVDLFLAKGRVPARRMLEGQVLSMRAASMLLLL